MILEDARIDPACVSGAIDDLQRGLKRTGVEVQRAWFREGIGRFADARGGVRELRELAAWRQQYIVLVHTDGSGFHYQAEFNSLDALAEWPRVAVLDPRSAERRDRATDPLADVRPNAPGLSGRIVTLAATPTAGSHTVRMPPACPGGSLRSPLRCRLWVRPRLA